jgi:ribonucleoside-diphosphate reductase alpha chain
MCAQTEEETVESAEQEIPILTTDENATVSDRLTDAVENQILPSRYLDKDADGTVTETPAELFERVADNVATAEYQFADEQGKSSEEAKQTFTEWRNEFEYLMKTQHFTPNSPTLMNAGLSLQQLSACISGDTPIYTKDGLKMMKNINKGDKVLTHSGQFKHVTAHWSNGVKETVDVKRGRSYGDNYSVTATPDHEVLTTSGEWKELKDVTKPAQPKLSPQVDVPSSFDLTKYTATMNKDKPVVSDGGVLRVENGNDPRTGEYDKQYSEVVASVENNDALAYIAGAYLAEGDVDGSDLRFTIGSDEGEFEKRIVKCLSQLFDVHVAVTESNHGKWKTITASSPFIADFFLTQFGTGSAEKRIPEWMFATNNSYQKSVLDGILDGDGYNDGSGWKLTLANPTLAYEVSLLARNIGYSANFTLEAENQLSANPTSRVRICEDSKKTHMDKVSKRMSGEQEVYDMEVADDHSFVAGDFVVHNCFVNSPADDLEDIAQTEKEWTLVQKTGGGMGGAFHHLRPKGALISTTKGVSSGPVSFMTKFDDVAGVIKQGGKRRGAQMAIMRVDHPDVGRFAVCKRREGEFSNFNISTGITDEFKEAVENDESYTLRWSKDGNEPFTVVQETANFYSPEYEDSPEQVVDENLWRDYANSLSAWDWDAGERVSFREKWEDCEDIYLTEGEEMELPARFIWDILIDGAWRNGEPGLFYIDETNRKHSFDVEEHPEFKVHATNPCAEQPLCEYEACNLGHINLSLLLESDAPTYDEWVESVDYDYTTEKAAAYDYFEEAVDFEKFDRVINAGTRFLDNVVTMSEFPLEEIEERVRNLRKIGLGVMGWAQMLYQMGIRYGSSTSFQMARIVMGYIDQKATQYSHKLARERGSFKQWDKSKYANPTEYAEWFKSHTYETPEQWEDGYPMRNHNVTTVAPTGTTSMIADTSGGIEPVHAVAFAKNVGEDIRGDELLMEYDKIFLQTVAENEDEIGYTVDEMKELIRKQIANNSFEGVSGLPVPDWMKQTFVTTDELTSQEHGLMQRAFQEAVDSGISKTVNLPKEATHADVHNAYMLALAEDKLGAPIKGLTVYRDQSREKQVVSTQQYSDREVENAVEMLEEVDGYTVITEDKDTIEEVLKE